ncbi:MAG: BTAD domain-containing putative transcriptional regulator [Thermoleophilia bacterium]
MDFRILGPLEVVDDGGEAVDIPGQKQRALLAILLLHANEVVSTERLVDDLWGEHVPRTVTASLQNLVSQLRKALGADRLATRAPGYSLRVDPHELDLARFEQAVRSAGELAPEERSAVLGEALALWRGPALADFELESFAQADGRRLEELRLAVLEDRIDTDLERDRHATLVGELEALVGRHPLRERLRGQLMLALYRSGRQAEALQAYQDARRALVEELGIEPSPALQQLQAAILRQEGALQPRAPTRAIEDHYDEVARALAATRLVLVLGPAVALAGRPAEAVWDPERAQFAPGEADVAAYLARSFGLEHGTALTRVSQHVALTQGVGPLYDELHALYGHEYPPSTVHRFLAALAPLLRARGLPHQLIVTTGYDHTLERAFADAGEELDVVSYIALGGDRGKFLHASADGAQRVVDEPNAYADVTLERRTVLLKIHGQVDPDPAGGWDSFVVSEDDYIDYLAQSDAASMIPVTLAAKLRRSHFLFLGYGLEAWNLRVFLRRVFGQDRVAYRSWAVEPTPGPLARDFWRERDVEVFAVGLCEYVEELRRRAEELLVPEVPA